MKFIFNLLKSKSVLWQSTKKIITFGILIFSVLINIIFFQNCSEPDYQLKLGFSSSATELQKRGVLINDDAPFTNTTEVLVQLSADGASQVYLTHDSSCESGGTWQPYTIEKPWVLSEKNHENRVYAKFQNNAGEISECKTDSIVHDDIAPILSLNKELAPATNQASIDISLSSTDDGSGVEQFDCTPSLASCKPELQFLHDKEGYQNLKIIAVDRAGNASAPVNLNWLFDKTGPENFLFTKTPLSKTSLTTADFAFRANDAYFNTVSYRCKLDNLDWATCNETSVQLNNLQEGNHALRVITYDQLGNASNENLYQWLIAKDSPTLTITKHPEAYESSLGAQFEFHAKNQLGESLSEFQCKINSNEWQACTSPLTIDSTALKIKTNTIAILVKDSENLESIYNYSWIIDSTPPVIAWIDVPPELINSPVATLRIDLEAIDAESAYIKSVVFKLDGNIVCQNNSGRLELCSLLQLSDGLHHVQVLVTDVLNRSSLLETQFTVDITPPTISELLIPTPSNQINLTVPVEVNDVSSYTANQIQVWTALDSEAFELSNSVTQLSFSNISQGFHNVKAYAVDSAGNRSATITSNTFLVDQLAPQIVWTLRPPTQVAYLPTIYLGYVVSDQDAGLASIHCSLRIGSTVIAQQNSCPAVDPSRVIAINAAGTYVFEITATDGVGNTAIQSLTWSASSILVNKVKTFSITSETNNDVDILLVIDNSGSMIEEQYKMATAFSSFISGLSGLNWRIGITTTDTSYRGSKGGLIQFSNGAYFIDQNTVNKENVFATGVQTGISGSGDENGFYAISLFLDRVATTTAIERQFFRSSAIFTTIVVSDSDELQNGSVFNAINGSIVESYLSTVRSKMPVNKSYVHHSIVKLPGDASCTQVEQEGLSYFETSQITSGISASICLEDYGAKMRIMGQTIINKVNEQKLECVPVDRTGDGRADVTITNLNNNSLVTDFMISGDTVQFTSHLTQLGDYTIQYSCIAP